MRHFTHVSTEAFSHGDRWLGHRGIMREKKYTILYTNKNVTLKMILEGKRGDFIIVGLQ